MHVTDGCAQLDFIDPDSSAITIPFTDTGAATPAPRAPEAVPALASTDTCEVRVEADPGVVWVALKPGAPAKFTIPALRDMRALQDRIAARFRAEMGRGGERLRYQVFSSHIPGIFSLGGDLALFRDCIRRQDAAAMRAYAREAVDLVYASATGYELPVTTIALVQGEALGGGFEAALAAQVLVAERSARMGLPEILFNMFPGMGAFQLLSRRLSPAEAERMILSGRNYDAEELHAMGVVDELAEDGDGEQAVRRYIRRHDRQAHGRHGLARALRAAEPLDRQALYRVADVWVETAMGLSARDLETIDYLLRAQERQAARAALSGIPTQMMKEA